ncbi:MAG: efflux transporter outer membrane subunit [Nevskia sp.]|nr:efflux transporter outer membrane subunit [Nevskia sp.]
MRRTSESRVACTALVALLAGCSLAPAYQVPPIPLPAQYREPAPWTEAQPSDQLPRGSWWTLYDNAELSALESVLEANNPDLAAALAHYEQARAFDAQVRSQLFPLVSGMLDASRDRQSNTRPLRGSNQPNEYGAYTAGLQADYEVDLWGRVHNEVSAAHAETEAAAADLASARLSLEARLADDYVSLLGLDREIKLFLDTVAGYDKALSLTRTLHEGGVVSGLDVSRAQTQLDDTKAQLSELQAQRALLEHAIAVLVGAPPPGFSLPADVTLIALPQIPAGIPSTLLQRRPDIAAAERRTAAANASVGVARAAFYPDISLSALIGVQSTSTGSWLTAPSAYWAVGPNLVQYLFDGGLRRAELDRAKAVLDESGARYRSVVLEAFRQVEDNLALLANYGTEYADQTAAVAAAQHTLDLSLEQYRDGAVDYLNVVESQVVALATERAQLRLETRRLRASVDLIRALGGGWSAADLEAGPRAAPAPGSG